MHPLCDTVYTNSSQGAANGKDKVVRFDCGILKAIVVRACVWRNSGGQKICPTVLSNSDDAWTSQETASHETISKGRARA